MIKRRHFINRAGLLGVGAALSGCSPVGSSLGSMPISSNTIEEPKSLKTMSPGIQLYTLRDAMSKSPAKVLEALAHIGYQEVELAGLPAGHSADEFRALLDKVGLRCPAMHIQGPIESQSEIAHSVGAELMVLPVPMPLLNEQWRLRADATLDDFRQFAETLNQMGSEVKRHGLQFGFHNHAWEMAILEGQLAYELLLTETDPELVFMELDLGWTHVGKVDALDLMQRHPNRFKTCHVKDFSADGDMVNAGEGVVPLAEQLLQRDVAGLQHFFIEHDDTKDALESARIGYEFLSALPKA